MNRYATDRVWPLYLFFVAALLACAYVLVSQVPDALDGEIRAIFKPGEMIVPDQVSELWQVRSADPPEQSSFA